MSEGYHHGDLRRVLLGEAALAIAEAGPQALSMRDLARRAGVSHAAPAHHFGDRRGLFTALATEGLLRLAEALEAVAPQGFDEVAVAYVRCARQWPGHYRVMYRPELVDGEAPEHRAAAEAAAHQLARGVRTIPAERRAEVSEREAGRTAWALVHGIATLAADGALPVEGLDGFTRRAARQLFG